MKYFNIDEFTKSDTAKKRGIDNTPEQWQVDNVEEFVNIMLDPLREDWEKYCKNNNLGNPAIIVSSGIRSKALNNAVGGSKTSSHYYGFAADLIPKNGRLKEFKDFCIYWLKDKVFDQMISEDENTKGVPGWIHLGYKRYDGSQRKQFLRMKNGVYSTI